MGMSTYADFEFEIEFVIAAARRTGRMERHTMLAGFEVSAHPLKDGRIAWSVDRGGITILYGVRLPAGRRLLASLQFDKNPEDMRCR